MIQQPRRQHVMILGTDLFKTTCASITDASTAHVQTQANLMTHVEITCNERGSKDAPMIMQCYFLAKVKAIARLFCEK